MEKIKNICNVVCGVIGAFVNNVLGGWSGWTLTLVIIMFFDWFTGTMNALVFKNSPKSDNGKYTSKSGFRGIFKKCIMLFLVLIGHRLDLNLNVDYFQIGITIALVLNEMYSIKENLELMDIKIDFFSNMIEHIKNYGKK